MPHRRLWRGSKLWAVFNAVLSQIPLKNKYIELVLRDNNKYKTDFFFLKVLQLLENDRCNLNWKYWNSEPVILHLSRNLLQLSEKIFVAASHALHGALLLLLAVFSQDDSSDQSVAISDYKQFRMGGQGRRGEAGKSWRKLSLECKTSASPGVASQERQARNQHGWTGTRWPNWRARSRCTGNGSRDR